MGRGRKATPTVLKVLRGNPGKRGLNHDEPVLDANSPEAPSYLSRDARDEWERIVRVLAPARVLTAGDFGIVLVASQAYAQERQCDKYLARKKSLSYQVITKTGEIQFKTYPEVAQRNQARRQYISALSEMGLTPSSRSRVKSIPAQSTDGVGKFFGAS